MKKREEEILRRAKKLFSEKGFHSLTVSDIVDSLGIARGTFYLYFKNKDDIYKRVLEELVDEISSRLKLLPRDNPIGQLRENLREILSLFVEDEELAKLVLYHPYRMNPEFDEILDSFFEEVKGLIERALFRGMEMGIVRECNVNVVSAAVLGAFLEIGKELLEGKIPDVEGAVEELLELSLKGLLEG